VASFLAGVVSAIMLPLRAPIAAASEDIREGDLTELELVLLERAAGLVLGEAGIEAKVDATRSSDTV